MKVLFVYTNINGFHADSYGFGLAHIMSVTKQAGHEIKLVSILDKNGYQEVTDTFKEFKRNFQHINRARIEEISRIKIYSNFHLGFFEPKYIILDEMLFYTFQYKSYNNHSYLSKDL